MNLGTPWMLFLLPLVVLAGWLMVRSRRLQREAACRLKGIAPDDGRIALGRSDWLALGALVSVVLALARPQWNPRPYEIERRGRDLVIVLDVSRSMLAADVFPSRLEMARIAIHEALPALAGQRISLVTFAGSASVCVPLTLDYGFVRYMLERADPSDLDVGSTSLQAAFEKVATAVLTDAADGRRDVVVFTDGEDHLSDLEETADLLANCGARVLIVGLGDPVRGARVPDPRDDDQWMQHNNVDVISRLEEGTLTALAEKAANVTYHSARTRPFDLVPLYRQLIMGADEGIVVGGARQTRYTEGYPYLLALAVILWLASVRWKPKLGVVMALILLVPGCSSHVDHGDDIAFQTRFMQGGELLSFAQEQSETDPFAERSLLVDAREQFLLAALAQPGRLDVARQISAITRRLHELDKVIERQRAEERQRQEKLVDTIRRLESLVARQKRLAERSRRVLRRPVPTGEQANLPESEVDSGPRMPKKKLGQLASSISAEQRSVRGESADILDGLAAQQETLRQILTRAYGATGQAPPTEVDPVVDLLAMSVAAQNAALVSLAEEAVRWPRANTALHVAAGRMQQALDALRSLLPPATDEDNDLTASRKMGDDENMDGLDFEPQDSGAQALSPGDFQEALSLQSLPIPDYTSAEIMAEEAANQQKRARRRAVRAGARVEKNW